MTEPGNANGGLARLTGTRWEGVTHLAETASTNTVLIAQAQAGAPEGTVVVAEHQTAGRGRFDRRWESPPGASLLFSVLLCPPVAELPPGRRHLAVAAVSLAVAASVRVVAGAGAELALKWPNDLVVASGHLAGRKVAGALAESVPLPTPAFAMVVGLGLNVHWAPGGGTAACVDDLTSTPADRDELMVEALLALDELYGRWDLVSRRYREACATVGQSVTVSFGPPPAPSDLLGTAVDVDPDGRLVVRTSLGEVVKVAAGDVVHATPAGPPRVNQQ